MSRVRSSYRCRSCGATALRWSGRCPACAEWNTLGEVAAGRPLPPGVVARRRGADGGVGALPPAAAGAGAVALAGVDGASSRPQPTGVGELDRVLGGGLVPGSVTLVGGEPGTGKSTLLLQVLGRAASEGGRALLVSAEESPEQVKRRADRLGVDAGDLWIVGDTDMDAVRAAVHEVDPALLVVDSIQTVWDGEFDASPGSVAQVRGCAQVLVAMAKARAMATVIVGHVTKDGTLAGPRLLEHVVDTVVTVEGDRHHALRLLRASKHRFGPTGELGVMEMTGGGLEGVADASGLFLSDRRAGSPGSVVFPAVEGHRPLLVEVQALVVGSELANPRRQASGLDAGRLALLLAVLAKRTDVALGRCDVYASVAGGVRVREPGADLAVGLALASAAGGWPLPAGLVAVGEVGLAGELRHASQLPRRLAESARLGFTDAVVPAGADVPRQVKGLRTWPVRSLGEAVVAVAQM
ncbi:MAG TPA: DNA repair protein RadA [Acidimicrobiales bacterium]|nr:DNA repair protein RadA [Acidimicrobiales bacterium]